MADRYHVDEYHGRVLERIEGRPTSIIICEETVLRDWRGGAPPPGSHATYDAARERLHRVCDALNAQDRARVRRLPIKAAPGRRADRTLGWADTGIDAIRIANMERPDGTAPYTRAQRVDGCWLVD